MKAVFKSTSTRSLLLPYQMGQGQSRLKTSGRSETFHNSCKPSVDFPCRTVETDISGDSEGSGSFPVADERHDKQKHLSDSEHDSAGTISSTLSQSSVRFDMIEIMEFSRQLGDNPSVRSGAPIALGTKCLFRTTISVDEYESAKPKRLSRDEMLLDGMDRMDLLKEFGYGRNEIREAAQSATATRESRNKATEKFLKSRARSNLFHQIRLLMKAPVFCQQSSGTRI
jgi:hypothetical protein